MAWQGAVQSQEFVVARWSLAQRTAGTTGAGVDEAFAAGRILRTHVLRPTWHFVPPADVRWMLALTAPRVRGRLAVYDRRLGLDDRTYARTNTILAGALEGGHHLTRKELGEALARGGIRASGQRLGHITARAELDAVVVSGAPRGKQQTYAAFDERAPKGVSLDGEAALAELSRRFVTAHGPAMVQDFAWWSGLKMGEARRGLDLVGDGLERLDVDGRAYWWVPVDRPARPRRGVIDLVQGYDETVVAYRESKDVLYRLLDPAQVPRERATYLHAILLDGELLGHWKPVSKRDATLVETWCYRPLKPTHRRALEAAVRRYGEFLGRPTTLVS